MVKGIFPALGLAIAVALAGGPAFAGDPVKGEKVFKKCKACHSARSWPKTLVSRLYGS